MNLAVSNLAWEQSLDIEMYKYLQKVGYQGIEIAPTKVFAENPYNKLSEAQKFAEEIKSKYNLLICSMQSIWYNRSEQLFGNECDRTILLEYTKKAVDFAHTIGCSNLVFGCPKNRIIQDRRQYSIALDFFRELGEYAYSKNTVIAIEPNPPIYNTNFINTTEEAFALCCDVNSKGIAVNIDFGTIIENNEALNIIERNLQLVNHIHISEPNLVKLEKRDLHRELANILHDGQYKKFVSIEMQQSENISVVRNVIDYIRGVFS